MSDQRDSAFDVKCWWAETVAKQGTVRVHAKDADEAKVRAMQGAWEHVVAQEALDSAGATSVSVQSGPSPVQCVRCYLEDYLTGSQFAEAIHQMMRTCGQVHHLPDRVLSCDGKGDVLSIARKSLCTMEDTLAVCYKVRTLDPENTRAEQSWLVTHADGPQYEGTEELA